MGLLIGRLGDGASFQIDAVLEHGSDLDEGFVFGVEVSAVLDIAKGGLEDSEAVTCLEDVKEILGFNAAHRGNLCIYGNTVLAICCWYVGDECHSTERESWPFDRGAQNRAQLRSAGGQFAMKKEPGEEMNNTRVFKMAFASVYPHYIAKAEKKGRTSAEVRAIICWLTGYDDATLQRQIDAKVDFEKFFAEAPRMNPNVTKITGTICGYRVEQIEDKLMQKIRYLDKLVDELAQGKTMEKILRK